MSAWTARITRAVLYIWLLILADSAVAASMDDRVSVPGFLDLLSTNTWPVEIWANGLKFSIPRNYLETAAHIRTGGVFFRIVTTYPEFVGATPGNIEQFRAHNWWRYPNTIVIHYVDDARQLTMNQDFLERSKNGELVDADFGLKLWKGHLGYPSVETFVNFDESAVIQCSKMHPESGPRCTVRFTVEEKVSLQVEYLRDELRYWSEINRGVRSQIEKFLVKDAQ
jgi:hypothetical protein